MPSTFDGWKNPLHYALDLPDFEYTIASFGRDGDVPLPGSYANAKHAVPAVYRPSTGEVLVAGHESFETGFVHNPPVLLTLADGLVPATVVAGS
jgi:hypothetical protein